MTADFESWEKARREWPSLSPEERAARIAAFYLERDGPPRPRPNLDEVFPRRSSGGVALGYSPGDARSIRLG